MVKKVASIGACVTRDNFNSRFNENYKDYFDLVYHQNQISILSLMSSAIDVIQDQNFDKLNDFGKNHFKSEADKRFFKLVVERNPEYLLIDFDADVNFGAVELDHGVYFTNTPKFRNLETIKDSVRCLKMANNIEEYVRIWKLKVDQFFKFMQEELPNCKIILVKAKFIDQLIDGSSISERRQRNKVKALDFNLLNLLWKYLNDYVETKYSPLVIDMTENNYYIDPEHPWGAYYLHYEKKYYNDFLNKLITLTNEN